MKNKANSSSVAIVAILVIVVLALLFGYLALSGQYPFTARIVDVDEQNPDVIERETIRERETVVPVPVEDEEEENPVANVNIENDESPDYTVTVVPSANQTESSGQDKIIINP